MWLVVFGNGKRPSISGRQFKQSPECPWRPVAKQTVLGILSGPDWFDPVWFSGKRFPFDTLVVQALATQTESAALTTTKQERKNRWCPSQCCWRGILRLVPERRRTIDRSVQACPDPLTSLTGLSVTQVPSAAKPNSPTCSMNPKQAAAVGLRRWQEDSAVQHVEVPLHRKGSIACRWFRLRRREACAQSPQSKTRAAEVLF